MERMTNTPEPMDDDSRRDNRKGDAPRGSLLLLLLLIGLSVVALILWQSMSPWSSTRVDYSTFLSEVEAGNVRRVVIDGLTIKGEWVKVPETRTRADKITKEEFRKEFLTSIPVIEERKLLDTLHAGKVEDQEGMAEVVADDVGSRQIAEPSNRSRLIALAKTHLSHSIRPAGIIKRSRHPGSRRLRTVIQIIPFATGRHQSGQHRNHHGR